MDNSNINDFIRKHADVNRAQLVRCPVLSRRSVVDRFLQLVDVAQGLEYLHGLNFIHGDLKGVRQLDPNFLRFPTDSSE